MKEFSGLGELYNDIRKGDSVIDKKFKPVSLIFFISVFITCVVVTNIIGTKVMTLWGFDFTAGVITYALVFLCTDVIGEIWGKRIARYVVVLGFLGNLLMMGFVYLAIISPPAPYWVENQDAYANVLGNVKRIVIASMIAYLISQLHDVWAFDYWRKKTQGKRLWQRNILSTFTSQFIDTIVFIIAAFAGQIPAAQIFGMIVGQIIIKWILAILDTPIIIGVCKLLGKPIPKVPTYEVKKK